MRNFIPFIAVFAVAVGFAPYCSADAARTDASPTEVERSLLERDIDNSVQPAPDKMDYDKISSELKTALKLDVAQERNMRAVLRRHNREYNAIAAEYGDVSTRLSGERDSMMRLRERIKKALDRIPEVILSRLESDQQEDYKRYMLEQKGVTISIAGKKSSSKAEKAKEKAKAAKKASKKRRKKAAAADKSDVDVQAAPQQQAVAEPAAKPKRSNKTTAPEAKAAPSSDADDSSSAPVKKAKTSAAAQESSDDEQAAPPPAPPSSKSNLLPSFVPNRKKKN